MNDRITFKRVAAISAILAAPAQLVFMMIGFLAIGFDTEIMADQSLMLTLGDQAAEMFHKGEILDIFGFYLLLIPVMLYLRHWLRTYSPNLVDLFTVFGLGSLFFGVAAAAIRYGAMTEMMHTYARASGPEREMLAVDFKVLIDVIFSGLGTLEVPFLGVWLLGVGWVLRRERRIFGLITTILSIGYLGTLVGGLLEIDLLIVLFTGIIVPIFPIWTLCLGLVIWRRGEQSEHEQMVEAAAAA